MRKMEENPTVCKYENLNILYSKYVFIYKYYAIAYVFFFFFSFLKKNIFWAISHKKLKVKICI